LTVTRVKSLDVDVTLILAIATCDHHQFADHQGAADTTAGCGRFPGRVLPFGDIEVDRRLGQQRSPSTTIAPKTEPTILGEPLAG
jgi:hypothetical protein